ncbi:MAG: hypothetical protein DSM106950_27775 [Stigonema ocellatum SAG 48.90 = DSM 106950]|nr:hypothetical protein [Stigonema ocellatum SAG 48.90 = DSM 106950]
MNIATVINLSLISIVASSNIALGSIESKTYYQTPNSPSICDLSPNKKGVKWSEPILVTDSNNNEISVVLDKEYSNPTNSFFQGIFDSRKAKKKLFLTIWTKDGLLFKYLVKGQQWARPKDLEDQPLTYWASSNTEFNLSIDSREYRVTAKMLKDSCQYGQTNVIWADEPPLFISFSEDIQNALKKTSKQSKIKIICRAYLENKIKEVSFDIGNTTIEAWKALK